MLCDLIYGLRILRRSPGFAAAAVVTFALGIGANTAIFSIVDAAILRPLPYDAPDRLVTITLHNQITGRKTTGAMPRDFLDWRASNDAFEHVALIAGGLYTLLGAGEPEEIRIVRVTAGYFEMLHTAPALGRSFTAEDEQPDSAHVAIISHDFWRTRFEASPDVIGRVLRLDGQPFEIVGVLPARFQYPVGAIAQSRVFLPFLFSAEDRERGRTQNMAYNPTARLKDGVTIAQAEAAMSQLQSTLDASHAAFNKGYTRVELKPLLDDYVGDARAWMLTLLASVGLVLIIACANVANLVLAHGITRIRELTVRRALGATRGRMVRQLLWETLLLSSLGGIAGLAVAWWSLGLLRATLPASIPRAGSIGLDARVFVFTTAIAILTGLACGLLPAFVGSGTDVVSGLKDGAPGTGASRTGRRARHTLAWIEIALAVVIVAGAGLFIKSFVRLLQVNQGFDAGGVASLRVSGPRDAEPEVNRRFVLDALAAVRGVPGVEAAVTESGPFAGGFSTFPVRITGRPTTGQEDDIRFRKIGAGFLELLHVPVVRGRGFSAKDTAKSAPVALINEMAVRRYLDDREPIGQRIQIQTTTFEIVGVVGNMRYGSPGSPAVPEVYLPYEQTSGNGGTIVFRAVPASIPAIKRAIWTLNPTQPISNLQTADETFGRGTAARRFNMVLMSVFAVLALAIAATGIYGVMAFVVGQRTREVGVRLALGARPSAVVGLFLKQGAAVVMTGLAAGTIAAWWLARGVQSFLYEVDARDPVVLAIVLAVLAVVALVACWIPARKAGRIDPVVALRAE
jgi:putative ABC transport system permease protein